MSAPVAVKSIGPVVLTREAGVAVEGACHEEGCCHTFVAFGEEAAETMARRHLVLVHPEYLICSRCNESARPDEFLCTGCRDQLAEQAP